MLFTAIAEIQNDIKTEGNLECSTEVNKCTIAIKPQTDW